jgi:DNA-binding NarL/FixJ family response regulator
LLGQAVVVRGESAPLPILLVERERVVREALRDRLADDPRLALVGACASTSEALEAIDRGCAPRAALIGVSGDARACGEGFSRLKARLPALDLVALLDRDDSEEGLELLRQGAVGCLLKSTPASGLARALLEAVQGGALLAPRIARSLIARMHRPPEPAHLSRREREVLEMLARGFSYREIGNALTVTLSTVESHIKAIYRKLHVCTKAEAAIEAVRRGLL